jgi:hypothetical protein
MNTAQEILSQQDVFLAIQQKRAAKKQEVAEVQQKISLAINSAIAPLPRATNRVEHVLQIARNAFSIWQGVSMGMKIIKGFRSAFKK